MAHQIALNYNIKTQNYIKKSKKYSISFCIALYLIVYMLLYFYLKALLTGESVEVYQSYFSLLANGILFCLCFYNLFVSRKLSYGKFKLLFFIFLCLAVISYLVNFSGLEKLIGLCDILMCIMLFQIYPIAKSEQKILFYLFIISVFFILINGTTDIDSQDENKFNPNTCAFLLSMLFCISIVIFLKTKSVFSLIFALISFGLQFAFISRTAMLACLIFFILNVLLRANKKTYKFKTVFITMLIFAVLGILFAYVYAEVLYPLWGHGKIKIFGKDLFTGREEIWHYTFVSIKENLLWGVGSHLNDDLLKSGFYELIINAHNQPMGLIAAFGLGPFIVFYIAFAYIVAYKYDFNKKSRVYYSNVPALFMLTITLMSWFDLYLFSQYNWIPIIITYCLICGYSAKEKN